MDPSGPYVVRFVPTRPPRITLAPGSEALVFLAAAMNRSVYSFGSIAGAPNPNKLGSFQISNSRAGRYGSVGQLTPKRAFLSVAVDDRSGVPSKAPRAIGWFGWRVPQWIVLFFFWTTLAQLGAPIR